MTELGRCPFYRYINLYRCHCCGNVITNFKAAIQKSSYAFKKTYVPFTLIKIIANVCTYSCGIWNSLFVAPWYINRRYCVDGILKTDLQAFIVSLVAHTVSDFDIYCEVIAQQPAMPRRPRITS